MRVKWSKHAHSQRMGIVRLIFREQTREIASKWNRDFGQTVRLLPPFPDLGDRIPEECFWTLPPDYERLRQTMCGPYRIVYEHASDEIRILAIMDCAMLIRSRDTHWS